MEITYVFDNQELPEEFDVCICRVCQVEKPTNEFYHYKYKSQSKYAKGLEYSKPIKICKTCKSEQGKTNVKANLVNRARARAIKGNLDFDITADDIVVPDVCPVLGMPIKVNTGKTRKDSIALDKINPLLGYVKGNVQVVSQLANTMKASASKEELLKFAKWVIETFKE